jgi:hypothetical protein
MADTPKRISVDIILDGSRYNEALLRAIDAAERTRAKRLDALAEAFEEWERRYKADPDTFVRDFPRAGTYGERMARYFVEILADLAQAKRVHKVCGSGGCLSAQPHCSRCLLDLPNAEPCTGEWPS